MLVLIDRLDYEDLLEISRKNEARKGESLIRHPHKLP